MAACYRVLEQQVYVCVCHTCIHYISHVEPQLIEEWQKFNQKIIDWAVKQWLPRLRSCVGEGYRDYCAVATQGVSKRNPCWPDWLPAGGRGQCVYACHRALASSMAQSDAPDFYI